MYNVVTSMFIAREGRCRDEIGGFLNPQKFARAKRKPFQQRTTLTAA